MPGENCCIVNCSRSRKDKGVSLWKLPTPKNPEFKKWREDMLQIILRDRVLNTDLQRQIDEDRLHICQDHFRDDQLWICEYLVFCFLYNLVFKVAKIGLLDITCKHGTSWSAFSLYCLGGRNR